MEMKNSSAPQNQPEDPKIYRHKIMWTTTWMYGFLRRSADDLHSARLHARVATSSWPHSGDRDGKDPRAAVTSSSSSALSPGVQYYACCGAIRRALRYGCVLKEVSFRRHNRLTQLAILCGTLSAVQLLLEFPCCYWC